ncbi:MAG: MerR family transcriptional regulator [Desulfobulbaceae bacterium]|nr:MerR family transcriptional regulator [Desulfobulbaceae bacterium]
MSEGGEYNSLIPEKKYFKISEVCEIAGLKQHVLRYWESEFKKMIRPHRASSKQRLYRRVDVENILTIKKLLKEDGFTIPGAKKFLSRAQEPKQVDSVDVEVVDQKDFLSGLKSELIAIQKILKGK